MTTLRPIAPSATALGTSTREAMASDAARSAPASPEQDRPTHRRIVRRRSVPARGTGATS